MKIIANLAVLFNFGKERFEVKKDDQITQLICEWIFKSRNTGSSSFGRHWKGFKRFWFHWKEWKLMPRTENEKKCTFFLKIKSFCLVFCTSMNLIALASKNIWCSYIKERVPCWDHRTYTFLCFSTFDYYIYLHGNLKQFLFSIKCISITDSLLPKLYYLIHWMRGRNKMAA